MADTRRRRRNYEENPEVLEVVEEVKNEAPAETSEENTEIEEPIKVSVEIPTEPIETITTVTTSKCQVNVPRLNLRQIPDPGSLILDVLNQNDTLKIIEELDAFYHVLTEDNVEGYVVKEYVRL